MGFCRRCAKQLADDAAFCDGCGTPTRLSASLPAGAAAAQGAPAGWAPPVGQVPVALPIPPQPSTFLTPPRRSFWRSPGRIVGVFGPIVFALGIAFLVFYPFGSSESSRQRNVAQILTEKVYNAAAEYYTIAPPGMGCPGLGDLVREGLIQPEQSRDPWGTQLKILCTGDVVGEVRSAGPDRIFSSDDDLFYDEGP